MGKRDQFSDKAEQLQAQAKQAMQAKGRAKDEASERASQGRDRTEAEARRAQQEAQDRFDQDYDA
ncbi:hypothetical protein AQF52_3402 [Streptomyces venezuelae]|uniref:hypothetical protein n=1 Tax=Streptomyces gardneri TaxID=66892 RepID=UPI0006BD0875|nr:hypothetical protein [Streptomyces gardneri]ALO08996.1 hypothetical protein AQF52_3402 [Streptomyces venezuelae]QPK46150.1 hypothetical protein H4W23_16930 [Streptomyces gardneri]WRK37518.1 hypothetical protein U0M97_17015 [Streptomyces venezuelae]CUM40612.1 hypothetical protein BN2537_10189 [Streptomyces venezuelae]